MGAQIKEQPHPERVVHISELVSSRKNGDVELWGHGPGCFRSPGHEFNLLSYDNISCLVVIQYLLDDYQQQSIHRVDSTNYSKPKKAMTSYGPVDGEKLVKAKRVVCFLGDASWSASLTINKEQYYPLPYKRRHVFVH